jgi:hypothetical protein
LGSIQVGKDLNAHAVEGMLPESVHLILISTALLKLTTNDALRMEPWPILME